MVDNQPGHEPLQREKSLEELELADDDDEQYIQIEAEGQSVEDVVEEMEVEDEYDGANVVDQDK